MLHAVRPILGIPAGTTLAYLAFVPEHWRQLLPAAAVIHSSSFQWQLLRSSWLSGRAHV